MLEPFLIQFNAIFDDSALHLTLGLAGTTLAKARKTGALRYCRFGNRTLYRGSWVLDWLEREASSPKPFREEPDA